MGLSRTVAELLGGMEVPVDVYGFMNDLVTFRTKDDVLTLLVHLGYLSYDPLVETACSAPAAAADIAGRGLVHGRWSARERQ